MSFVKENIFIILGITLPLILIGLLSLFQSMSKVGIEPPQYEAAYIVMDHPYGKKLVTIIDPKTKKLSISVALPKNTYDSPTSKASLYIYKEGKNLRSYVLDTQNIKESNKEKTVSIPLPEALTNTKFLGEQTSPDGYTYKRASYRNGSIMTEIFGYNRNNRKDTIVKETNRVRLPETSQWPKTHFVGWVEE